MAATSKVSNWEPKVCAGLGVILLLLLGWQAYWLLHEPEPAQNVARAAPQLPALFTDQAFAFLYPPPQLGAEHNAFRFRRSFQKPQRTPTNPGTTTVTPPPPPKPQRRINFIGWMETEGKPRAAFLEIADQRTGAKLHSGQVRAGDQVAGFTVLAIEEKAIKLRDPAGREQAAKLREPVTVELP